MPQNTFASELISELYFNAHHTFYCENHQDGIAKISIILANFSALSQREVDFLHSTREIWIKATDTTFILPEHPTPVDISALFIKSMDCRNEGDYEKAMLYSWFVLQHCASGTLQFLYAVFDIIEIAECLSDLRMARHASELFLSHYDLMLSASAWSFTPVGIDHPSLTHEWNKQENYRDILLPWQTALNYIDEDRSVCWARILRMQIDASSEQRRATSHYKDMLAALKRYYVNVGDIGGMEFLNAYQNE